MDGSDHSTPEYMECLRQLELINQWTGGYRPTLQAIGRFSEMQDSFERPLRILDIGFGHGDTLRMIAKWARKKKISVDLLGIDIEPLSAKLAQAATPEEFRITYRTEDIFEHRPDQPYDVILNSLFMHHLTNHQAVRVLRWMRQNSRLGFFINDLQRNRLAMVSIFLLTRLFGFNRLIRHDAPLSVARAFHHHELLQLGREADLDPARLSVRWHWAFRLGMTYVSRSS